MTIFIGSSIHLSSKTILLMLCFETEYKFRLKMFI